MRKTAREVIFRRDAIICISRISYGNVAGWCSPIIEAFGTPCADTKFQGEHLYRGRLIHGDGENWRFSTEMADISETVRDKKMVTGTLIGSCRCRI